MPVRFDKITQRIEKLCYGLDPEYVDPSVVAQKVCLGVYKGVTTAELDELAAETAAHLISLHPDFGILASRIAVSNLHKSTKKSFYATATDLVNYVDGRTNSAAPMIAQYIYDFILEFKDEIESVMNYDRDYSYQYFGLRTLQHSYLFKMNRKTAERPQHLIMRVCLGIWVTPPAHLEALHLDAEQLAARKREDLTNALAYYELMSLRYFTHATPTLFNAGTRRPQLASCVLETLDDSIEAIFDVAKDCAVNSKNAAGIGLAITPIRAAGSYIKGTGGYSNGIVPMAKVFNDIAKYVDQGGGKRRGAFALYIEPWHKDIFAFLDLKKNNGVEEERARDLFYALWNPDLFIERVITDDVWTLFCPAECTDLYNTHGAEFERRYKEYERVKGEAKGEKVTIQARKLWDAILDTQTETGVPYMLYKDAVNAKCNQKNLGTIRCSNLCCEVTQFTSNEEIASCNLASVALPRFLNVDKTFNHQKLFDVVYLKTRGLNNVIDYNYYPLKKTERSNLRHRPLGIGVNGEADLFVIMRLPFDSIEARKLNKEIFETMYFAALSASCDLAARDGPYPSYREKNPMTGECAPISESILQYELHYNLQLERWNKYKDHPKIGKHFPTAPNKEAIYPGPRWNWAELKLRILKYGVRNSLLLAPMPTASTAQIMDCHESFEPFTSNIYVRRTLAGEFVCCSRYLIRDLITLGLWTPQMKTKLVAHNGSVQNIPEIPADIKLLYRTVWEISQKSILEMAADRQAFIDQSQSLNIYLPNVNASKLTSVHVAGWALGLKTGMYYLRSKPATDAVKVTIDPKFIQEEQEQERVMNALRGIKPSTDVTVARSKSRDNAESGLVDFSSLAEREKQRTLIECSLSNPKDCRSCT